MIVLDRFQRDVLRHELVEHDLETLRDAPAYASNPANLGALGAWRERVDIALRLLDDLGWSIYDERARFEVTAPRDRLAGWLRDRLRDTQNCIRDEVEGDYEYFRKYGATDSAIAEMEADTRAQIDVDLDLIHVCGDVLAALGTTADQAEPDVTLRHMAPQGGRS